jgi:hypothetical protein
MSDLRQLIAKMDQIESGSLPKKKKTIKEDAAIPVSSGGDIIGGIKSLGPKVAKKVVPALGFVDAGMRAHEGDYTGAAIGTLGGITGAIPHPIAQGISLSADAVNQLRDYAKEKGGWGEVAKEISQSMKSHDDNNFLPENLETLDEEGLRSWLAKKGISAAEYLKNLVKPAEKEIADVSAARPTDISGIGSDVPGTIRVGTPAKPPEVPSAATTTKSLDQRAQAASEINAKLDTLPKPKINAKDYQAQLAKQQELEKQLKDPRPAVWKDPRNPELPASKSPPAANVEPPQPLNGKSFKDASAEVNKTTGPKVNRDELGRPLDNQGRNTTTLGGEPITYDAAGNPSIGTTPKSNFNRPSSARGDTEMGPEIDPNAPPEWFQQWQANQQAQQLPQPPVDADKPGILKSIGKAMWNNPKTTAAVATGAEYEREKNANWKGAKAAGQLAHPDDDFWSYQNQIKDFGVKPELKTPTKESLQNKLFNEFKTFVEKK